jgi:glycerol uptake facilitator-like aquaporin
MPAAWSTWRTSSSMPGSERMIRTPYAVGLYITSAYWFTASTSFANPAVTITRALSDTFAGIALSGVPAFIVAQLTGMLLALLAAPMLWPPEVR